jgi:hypothetical protein
MQGLLSSKERNPYGKERIQSCAPAPTGRSAHIDRLLDEALADSFPCSDPVATLIFDTPSDQIAAREVSVNDAALHTR